MNEFEQAKKEYEQIPVPEELADRVQAGIRQGRAKRMQRKWKRGAGAVAACLVLVVGTLNVSPTVAAAAADVPVLGGLFQVLTVRSYTEKNPDYTEEVRQPGLSGTEYAQEVDQEIQKRVDEKLAEGEKIVAEAKEAYLATGGTEEEWAQRDTTVSVDYEIKSQTDTTVSFVIDSYVSIASAYQEQMYYNLDLAEGRELTLEDVLGPDWVSLCNDVISAEIAEHPDDFFDTSMGGFTTVDETTSFYINEAGNPVVVFPKYTIAPGAMGVQEFEISK